MSDEPGEAPGGPAGFGKGYKNYALFIFSSMYLLTNTDRPMMGLLLQPIKEDLQLSDTQIGLLIGFGFGLVYAAAGLLIGRMADRGNRIVLGSALLALWSVACIAASFAVSFAHLMLARIVGAFGDASGRPITYSLIADYFPGAQERTAATYRWNLAGPISAVALVGVGYANEYWGWRFVFLITGLIGVPFILLNLLTLKEPRKLVPADVPQAAIPSLRGTLAWLWESRACRWIMLAMVLEYVAASANGNWAGAFVMRYHGIGTAEIAQWSFLGLPVGLGAAFAGTIIASRWLAGKLSLQLILFGGCFILSSVLLFMQLLVPGKHAYWMLSYGQAALNAPFFAAPFVVLQTIVPERMRTTAMMLIMTIATMLGMAIGPLLVGTLSDALIPYVEEQSLRWALLGFPLIFALSGLAFIAAAKWTSRELAAQAA